MSHNTWIHRGVRVIVRPLAKTAVTPNQITVLRMLTGLAAVFCFAIADPVHWLYWGVGLFVLSMLLDRADGELARLTGKHSAFGHRLDLISDALINGLVFVGIGWGVMRTTDLGVWGLAMGIAAGAAVATILWLVMRMEAAGGERAGELAGAAGFDPDDGILAVPLAMLFGLGKWLVIAAAIGAPGFAIYMFWKFRRERRTGTE